MPVIRPDVWSASHPRTKHFAALTLARSALRHLAQQADNESDREFAVEALERIAVMLGERPANGGRV